MNEFAPLRSEAVRPPEGNVHKLQVGDLVTMTIVDVFETDNQGKLLSYCPTFDNRAVHKTHHTGEAIRKSSSKFYAMLSKAQKSRLATNVMQRAGSLAQSMRQKVDQALHPEGSPPRRNGDAAAVAATAEEEEELRNEINREQPSSPSPASAYGLEATKMNTSIAPSGTTSCMGDDDMERHEV
jgi:hypothetical protein